MVKFWSIMRHVTVKFWSIRHHVTVKFWHNSSTRWNICGWQFQYAETSHKMFQSCYTTNCSRFQVFVTCCIFTCFLVTSSNNCFLFNSNSKLSYSRRWVSQSVPVTGDLGSVANSFPLSLRLSLDSCRFLREASLMTGRVCPCCWALPEQTFSDPNSAGLTIKFF
jgi:hypothetical protein